MGRDGFEMATRWRCRGRCRGQGAAVALRQSHNRQWPSRGLAYGRVGRGRRRGRGRRLRVVYLEPGKRGAADLRGARHRPGFALEEEEEEDDDDDDGGSRLHSSAAPSSAPAPAPATAAAPCSLPFVLLFPACTRTALWLTACIPSHTRNFPTTNHHTRALRSTVHDTPRMYAVYSDCRRTMSTNVRTLLYRIVIIERTITVPVPAPEVPLACSLYRPAVLHKLRAWVCLPANVSRCPCGWGRGMTEVERGS